MNLGILRKGVFSGYINKYLYSTIRDSYSVNHVKRVSYNLQRFAVVCSVAIVGSVVPRWTMDRRVDALTGSNPLRVVLGASVSWMLLPSSR